MDHVYGSWLWKIVSAIFRHVSQSCTGKRAWLGHDWHTALFSTASLWTRVLRIQIPLSLAYIFNLPSIRNLTIASHRIHMSYPLSEYSWKPPSANQILFSIDRIYASGVFWRVVSPPLLEDQSRIMSAIALMAEVLRATLPPRTDQSPPEGRYQRYVPRSNFQTAFSPAFSDFLRHRRPRKRNRTHSLCDINVNDASTRRRPNDSGSYLSFLSPQSRISPLCTTS